MEVIDNIAPTITCPSDTVVYVDAVSCSVSGLVLKPSTTTDNCAVDTVYNDGLTTYPLGETTVTWTVKDESGNTATCTQKVTVLDTIVPIITCADTLSVNVDAGLCTRSGITLTTPTISGNCTLIDTSNNALATYPLGITEVTWKVEDNSNNTSTCIQVVEVIDNIAPTITCPADTVVYVDGVSCSVSGLVLNSSTTTDNCSVDTIYNNGLATYPQGETTVTWTVEDESGNKATCTQKVTVLDTIAPMIICADTLSVIVDAGLCTRSGVTLTTPTISDNCILIDTSNNALATFPLGITEVTWTVEDNSNNISTCIQVVEVIDNENPTITCPSDTVVYVDGISCSVSGLILNLSTTSDNCAIDTVYNDGLATYPLEETSVTWTVEDESGNTATCTQKVTVLDMIVPTITCADTLSVNVDAGLCTRSGVTLTIPTISDNCTLIDTSNNALATYPLGITEVIWTVEDNSNNTSTCIQVVEVIDNENPTITCPSDTIVYVNAVSCSVSGLVLNPSTTTDNCAVDTVYNDGLTTYPLGETTVTWTVEDESGNTATCTQKVTVLDTIVPTIICADTLRVNVDSGLCTRSGVTLTTPTISDNCTLIDTSNNDLATYPLGITEVTWTVEDNSNNTSTCIQVVEVIDNEVPTISCPSDTVVYVDGVSCSVSGLALNPSAHQIIVQKTQYTMMA